MKNSLETVVAVAAQLRRLGIACDLFGGWAEEILGIREPSTHSDIDMIYRSENFEHFDLRLKEATDFKEVPLKRFRHKRAFQYRNTLCEIMLVKGQDTPTTLFWGDVPFLWDTPLLHRAPIQIGAEPLTIVSAGNLARYRRLHKTKQPHRWRDPEMLEPYE